MAPFPDLDESYEACACIPFDESAETLDSGDRFAFAPDSDDDFPGGLALRLRAGQIAWAKCLQRVQEVVRALHAPLTEELVRGVRVTYTKAIPGMPLEGIPTFLISSRGETVDFLDEVVEQLSSTRKGSQSPDIEMAPDQSREGRSEAECFISHMHAEDCTSLMLGMKSLISGFISQGLSENGKNKTRSTASLAAHDINLLVAWYFAVRKEREEESSPKLVTIVHNFEQFDAAALTDMIYVCSLHVQLIPFVFIFLSSSPSPLTFLQSTYTRSTLGLLSISQLAVPASESTVQHILEKVFLDAGFDADVMPGPATLGYIVNHCRNHGASVDAVTTMLQLAHRKHFEDHMSIFAQDELLGTDSNASAEAKLSQAEAGPFLDTIITRIYASDLLGPSANDAQRWLKQSVHGLLETVAEARQAFRQKAARLRRAWACLSSLRSWMAGQGNRAVQNDRTDPLERILRFVKGDLVSEANALSSAVKKVDAEQLGVWLQQWAAFLMGGPAIVQDDESWILDQVAELLRQVEEHEAAANLDTDSTSPDETNDLIREIAESAGTLLREYLEERMDPLDGDGTMLWSIWYMGATPFPSELIDPAPRACIDSALLYPHEYLQKARVASDAGATPGKGDDEDLPDTSILFRRYMDGGKMINVYDWYESFAQVLEEQRKKRAAAGMEQEDEDEEKWGMQVQARFIRALHELDYLGFIKHTGRKADHIIRTVYDLPD